MKPNPYVELTVNDNRSTRKTEFLRNTYSPKWNEDFTVLVTPNSTLTFKVLDHSSFRRDTVLGEHIIQLNKILHAYNGRCKNLELNIDLYYESKSDGKLISGELVIVLNGLKVELTDVPPLNNGESAVSIIK